ncbi:MAG: hypothetical protein C0625_11730 [Arcobacter sp.]|nr:MAG: hypothetical protein C0625_11730 [Arcobacter sp.]
MAVLTVGVYGIYAQSMIYRIKARPSWNKKETTNIFFNVSYIGILIIGLVLILNAQYSSASVVIPFAFFISFLQYIEFTNQNDFYKYLDEDHKHFYQLNKTKVLYEEHFKKYNDYRKISLYIGALALPLFAMLLLAAGNYSNAIFVLSLAIAVSFSSEIVSRLLFYKTAVAQGLAGNFFAGNQRG